MSHLYKEGPLNALLLVTGTLNLLFKIAQVFTQERHAGGGSNEKVIERLPTQRKGSSRHSVLLLGAAPVRFAFPLPVVSIIIVITPNLTLTDLQA